MIVHGIEPGPALTNAQNTLKKITELTDEQKAERRKAYEMFQKLALAKAKLMSEAIGDLNQLGFDFSDMKIETVQESGDEFLKLNGEAVYKAEMTRENQENGDPKIIGVKGYWLRKVIQPKAVATL